MESYLMHHGILGQKWGIRRYQNKDGSLTEAGRRHYGYAAEEAKKTARIHRNNAEDFDFDAKRYSRENKNRVEEFFKDNFDDPEYIQLIKMEAKDSGMTLDEYLADELDDAYNYNSKMRDEYIKSAKEWESKADRYLNATSIKDLSKEDIDDGEKLVKQYMKYSKKRLR